jgi:hypothetical protein
MNEKYGTLKCEKCGQEVNFVFRKCIRKEFIPPKADIQYLYCASKEWDMKNVEKSKGEELLDEARETKINRR